MKGSVKLLQLLETKAKAEGGRPFRESGLLSDIATSTKVVSKP